MLRKLIFLQEEKRSFISRLSHESILCQGSHRKENPFVTILITTYKRPELLKQALESALNQKGFDDYQIIVADNEGVPVTEETPTARLLKNYQDEKVIYYRHSQEVSYIADSAVNLARSPWVVFLHDDDLLVENHLAIMTGIVKKHKEIRYLGCPIDNFVSRSGIERELVGKNVVFNYTIQKYLKNATCLGNWVGWLGALISRKHYIAMGGMSLTVTGCNDMIMVAKFHHYFGTHKLSSRPLYYYRKGEQQATYKYACNNKWEKGVIDEYYFYKYVINKYHKLTHKLWERNIAYYILHMCEQMNSDRVYHMHIDIDRVISECKMPADIREKNILNHMTRNVFIIYKKCVEYLDYFYTKNLRRTDIHITSGMR